MAFRGLVQLGVPVLQVHQGKKVTPQTLGRPVPQGRRERVDKALQRLLDRAAPREILDAPARRVSELRGPLAPQEPRVQVVRLDLPDPLAGGSAVSRRTSGSKASGSSGATWSRRSCRPKANGSSTPSGAPWTRGSCGTRGPCGSETSCACASSISRCSAWSRRPCGAGFASTSGSGRPCRTRKLRRTVLSRRPRRTDHALSYKNFIVVITHSFYLTAESHLSQKSAA